MKINLKIIIPTLMFFLPVLVLVGRIHAVEPPTGLVATAESTEDTPRSALLKWTATATPSPIIYTIYMATWTDWTGDEDAVAVTDPDAGQYNVNTFPFLPSTTYYFWVTATDDNLDVSSPSVKTSVVFPAPPVVTNVTATAWPSEIKIQWSSVNRWDVDGYFLYRSTNPLTGFVVISTEGWVAPTTDAYMLVEDTKVTVGLKYYYKLTAFAEGVSLEGNLLYIEGGFSSTVSTSAFSDAFPHTYITQPISSQTITGTGVYTIRGTATDDHSVALVNVVIAVNGLYWSTSSWTAFPTFVEAVQDSSGTLVNWHCSFNIPVVAITTPGIIYALAEDNYEQDDDTGCAVIVYFNNSGLPPPPPPVNPDDIDISQNVFDIIVYPNPAPAKSTANIAYTITVDDADVDIKIYDRIGELVKKVVSGKMSAGTYVDDLVLHNTAGNDFAPGVYYVVAKMGSKKKIFKLKVNS